MPHAAVQGAPDQLNLWRRYWAPPGLPATPVTTALVLAGAAVAATSIPFSPGIGWAVTGIVGTAVIMLARHFRATPSGPPPLVRRPEALGWDRWFWGTATLLLLGVGTFRAAGWLFALCLVVAMVTGTLALTGGNSLRAIAAAVTMPPLAALRSIRWLGGGFLTLRGQLGTRSAPGTAARSGTTAGPGTAAGPATAFGPATAAGSGTAFGPATAAGPGTTPHSPAAAWFAPGSTNPPAAATGPAGTAARRTSASGSTGTGTPPAPTPQIGSVRILGTVAVSVLLLLIFGGLLASADPAFGDALSALVPSLDPGTILRWSFVFLLATLTIGACVYLRASAPNLSGVDHQAIRKVNRLEWAIPLALLTLLFAAFVTVQLAVLFGGARHVLETDGLTYAEYARGGFWQLSIVTLLTLAVLGGAAHWAPRATPADRILMRAILGTLTLLTLVIVASARSRMNAYVETYGLTELRLLVACCETWFGLVLVMVLLAGVRLRATWLPRTAIAAGALALIALAAANPDRLIAENNLHRVHHQVDLAYLASLSSDAVPALLDLPPAERACVLGQLRADLEADPADWRGWNLSRHNAEILLADYPASTYAVLRCRSS